MAVSFLLVFTGLILIGYLFEILSPKTRIPNVIVLLGLGMAARELLHLARLPVPDFTGILPDLGTVGLILIVLEGSLELRITPRNIPLMRRTALLSLVSIASMGTVLGGLLMYTGLPFQQAVLNTLPLSIISSAIAIPTARMLNAQDKEMVVFESSLSDIFGVMLFNYFLAHSVVNWSNLGLFLGQIGLSAVFSLAAALVLTFILSRLNHRIKFFPIIALILFLYALAKGIHLPALIIILAFGLFVANIGWITSWRGFAWLKHDNLLREIHRFEEISSEFTFVVRVSFFLVFGYSISLADFLNMQSLALAGGIVALIVALRAVQLRLMKLPLFPLLFVAPRGLITVLLFLSMPKSLWAPQVSDALITQVILLSSLVMMFATAFAKSASDVRTNNN
ncbi:MAG: sodium:proton antiporter [Schleiferiaceae bacterium]|nr:sodium:proton antiporter [Schleiferiaceae bacterium]MDP4627600.1 sodium:proton antiporter [Schleiferiaceae bacterium]MDP4859365.1 sodium:proton antiporter [Schleiferiaceae bacterium]MDP4901628.1 sodium:proton antiporter [Schleiferiaceae bacterium]